MARPFKDGLEYFPLDTTFFMDDKIRLLKNEYGLNGVSVFLYLLCEIYRTSGYYKEWDDEIAMLVSEGIGSGVDYKFINEIVACCIKRRLFSLEMYEKHKILTSARIQKTYIKACIGREEIRLIKDYLIIDINNRKDIPQSFYKKIVLINKEGIVINEENAVICVDNPINFVDNSQRKEKESKVNEIKEKIKEREREIEREKEIKENIKEEREEIKENSFTSVPDSSNSSSSMFPSSFSSSLINIINDWFLYKEETGEKQLATAQRRLIKKIKETILGGYEERVIIRLIELSMNKGWKGIFWERLDEIKSDIFYEDLDAKIKEL